MGVQAKHRKGGVVQRLWTGLTWRKVPETGAHRWGSEEHRGLGDPSVPMSQWLMPRSL